MAKTPLTWTEFQQFIAHLTTNTDAKGSEANYRLLVFTAMAGHYGISSSAILGLKWKDLIALGKNTADGWKPGGECKTRISVGEGSEVFTVHLDSALRRLITQAFALAGIAFHRPGKDIFDRMNDYIIPSLRSGGTKSVDIQYINKLLKEELVRFSASTIDGSWITLHKTFVRHSFQEQGANRAALIRLSETMKHSSAKYTAKYIGLEAVPE